MLGGRVSRGRGRGREGMEVQSQDCDSPAGRGFWGAGTSLPSGVPGCTQALRVPMVSEAVSPGRGGRGRGSYLEWTCEGRVVGGGAWKDPSSQTPCKVMREGQQGQKQWNWTEASERDHMSRKSVDCMDLRWPHVDPTHMGHRSQGLSTYPPGAQQSSARAAWAPDAPASLKCV